MKEELNSSNLKPRLSGLKNGELGLINRLITVAICFFVAILVSGALALYLGEFFPTGSRSYFLAMSVAQNVVGFTGAALMAAWVISRRPASFLGLSEGCGWRPLAGVVIVYIIGMPMLNQLVWYNEHIRFPEAWSGLEQTLRQLEAAAAGVTEVILSSTSAGSLVSGILIIGVLTGFSEEILFRGALQRSMEAYPAMRQWAVWLTAIIFSAVHMQFFGFFPRLLLGAFFGYMLYSTGSLWPGVFAHALNNSIVVATEWLARRYPDDFADASEWGVTTAGFPVAACVSLVLTVLFFTFCYRYFFIPQAKKVTKS